VRGLGDPDKCVTVRNVIFNAKPSVVCLQESKLSTISVFKAKTFRPATFSSSFAYSPVDGSRGGIITAWDPSLFALSNLCVSHTTPTTSFSCTATNLDFTLTNVYGPSDHSNSPSFLQHLCDTVSGSWALIGDFNLVRCAEDKSNRQFNASLANSFNDTLINLAVCEVNLSDRLYTWSDRQVHPILARLDRAFTNNDLNLAFPLTSLSSLPKPTSDHYPLVLSLSTNLPKPCSFRLENHWLKQPTFLQSVLASWDQAPTTSDAAGQLVACIKAARASAKVWSRCNRAPPTLIHDCQFLVLLFDYFEESRPLTPAEFQARYTAQERLQELLKEKAAYKKQ